MPISGRPVEPETTLVRDLHLRGFSATWLWILLIGWFGVLVHGMSSIEVEFLRRETINVFYHGFDNYMEHAFPEDELKPVSCIPLTRDRANPAHIEVNDVLGNYSLTLIDSLSTLAILSSSPDVKQLGRSPLTDFQNGIASIVELYGDGTNGSKGEGTRSRGFDLDSKVQVFETVIRGVGGLLSAHLFATGDLPITNYTPKQQVYSGSSSLMTGDIKWDNGFVYNGQLLRLALDLGQRLLPAFHTITGLPYPRVNLRHGVPFYMNSPLNWDAEYGKCYPSDRDSPEITETCSAGAGSLVLEFTTLSRLTGLYEFEKVARRAFWAVWERRTDIGLIGAGVDAESGLWIQPFTGIGAGIDSFFEYALKTHILLAGSPYIADVNDTKSDADFLSVWQEAHVGIKRHIYRSAAYQHPHYIQADVYTGAARAYWIDSLSAYYPGLLTLGGQVDEAAETHLLYTALWSRYSALPERWSTASGMIDSGLRWWGGRPEFIESTWYLYQATHDPWYLHVGEMALQDIQRRCWTSCGWAGLEDVRTGELKDRMESFFLGETVQYLYLLFDPTHPLNKLDAPFVFTTEGHPLLLPSTIQRKPYPQTALSKDSNLPKKAMPTCPAPPPPLPLFISPVASRDDIFHAAFLARLFNSPSSGQPAESVSDIIFDHPVHTGSISKSPTNYTYFPWTLPRQYVPTNGTSAKMRTAEAFDLSFPTFPDALAGSLTLKRVDNGIQIASVSGLKFGMIQEFANVDVGGSFQKIKVFRLSSVAHVSLGRDENVYVAREVLTGLNPVDQYFTKHRDTSVLDILVDKVTHNLPNSILPTNELNGKARSIIANASSKILDTDLDPELLKGVNIDEPLGFFNSLLQHFSLAQELRAAPSQTRVNVAPARGSRAQVAASIAIGIGAAPIPDLADSPLVGDDPLPWTSIHASDENCFEKLASDIPKNNQVLILKRGQCSFSQKLENIPAVAPSSKSLQLVIVVSYPEHETTEPPKQDNSMVEAGPFVRPVLESRQMAPDGIPRSNPIPLIIVRGGDETFELLKHAAAIGLRRRYHYLSQGLRMHNLVVL